MTNFALGPSWLPKLGGIICVFAGAMEMVPAEAPGAFYFKPYTTALMALGAGLVGFTARQNNKSTEEVTGKPVDEKPPVTVNVIKP